MAEEKEKNIQYYAVYYAQNGEIMLTPGKSQEECFDILEEKMNKTPDGKYREFCKATTIIKRDLNTITNPEYIFGCPKALDIKNNPRRKK